MLYISRSYIYKTRGLQNRVPRVQILLPLPKRQAPPMRCLSLWQGFKYERGTRSVPGNAAEAPPAAGGARRGWREIGSIAPAPRAIGDHISRGHKYSPPKRRRWRQERGVCFKSFCLVKDNCATIAASIIRMN